VKLFSRAISIFLSISLFTSIAYTACVNIYYSQAFSILAEAPKVILEQGNSGTSIIYKNNTSARINVSALVNLAPNNLEYGYAYKSSEISVSTTSGVPVDDPEAVLNITLEKTSHVLIIYNAGNKHGSTEYCHGKGCCISINGTEVAYSWQSPCDNNYANSVTVVYATKLTAGFYIIKGRFFSISSGNTVTIDTRQIAVFWFFDIVANYTRSTVQVTTNSTSPVDDPEAILTFNVKEKSVALIIYNAGNKHGSQEGVGKGITLNIDGSDIPTKQWQCPYAEGNYANSVTIAYIAVLTNGSHTIKGRFFSSTGNTVTIDERQLIAFCFPFNLVSHWFVESTTEVGTNSGEPVDDTEAILNCSFTYPSDLLILYTGGNPDGAAEVWTGKGVLVNVKGVDEWSSVSWQSTGFCRPNSATSVYCGKIEAGNFTIKGRFFENSGQEGAYWVRITHRQLAVLAFYRRTSWWNSSWKFRKPILINNTCNDNTLLNYQVFINITFDDNMKTDFSDLRFTWYNATTNMEQEIPYWIQNKMDSAYAEVWIKVPEILNNTYYSEENTTVHMYYGNPSASSASNGTETFDFFDDFNDNLLDANKWNTPIESGGITLEETGGELRISGTATEIAGSAYIFSKINIAQSLVIDYKVSLSGNGSGYHALDTGIHKDDSFNNFMAWYPTVDPTPRNALGLYHEMDEGVETIYVFDDTDVDGKYHDYRIIFNISTGCGEFFLDGSSKGTEAVGGLQNTSTLYVCLRGATVNVGDVLDLRIDDVRVRKYSSPEPTISTGAEQTIAHDYVLKVVNRVAENWKINLIFCNSSNLSRLSNMIISFHNNNTTSDQVIISNGVVTQSEGTLYDLAANTTIYISINNLQATNNEISYLYLYLKILVPNTSTYNLFMITFKIT